MMASLQSALSAAIQEEFQVEDRELASEPLPSADDRRVILLYEAAEGGAGVLRQIVNDPSSLSRIASTALRRCHFTPDGEDRGTAVELGEACESACYDCLRSYFNQRDHRLLDRWTVQPVLMALRDARVETSPIPKPREEQLGRLLRLCDSELERRWLRQADSLALRLPSDAQVLVPDASVRVDFFYADAGVAVFVDGPHHDQPVQRQTDRRQEDAMEDVGLQFLRFRHDEDWEVLFRRHAGLFGEARRKTGKATTEEPDTASTDSFDEFLFEGEWLPALRALAAQGVTIREGHEPQASGRNLDQTSARLTLDGITVHVVDARLPTSTAMSEVLAAGGDRVLVIDPTTEDLAERLRDALQGA